MVYTVTLNPALDYEVLVDGFRAGELNRTSWEHMHFGGKGVNVSTVLHGLGVGTTALGFVAGFTGKALEDGLKARGIPTDFIRLEEGLTRVNVKICSGGGSGETEINSQGPAIPPAALEALLQKLDRLGAGDVLVLAGSLPAGLPPNVYQTILDRVEGRGVLTVVDAARDLLKGVLSRRPFLIKPNSAELAELFGKGSLTGPEHPGFHGRGRVRPAGRDRRGPPPGGAPGNGPPLRGRGGLHGGRIFGRVAGNPGLRRRPPHGGRRRVRHRLFQRPGLRRGDPNAPAPVLTPAFP